MVKPRERSKRVPVRLRHKIEKRSKAHKERKEAKKYPQLYRKKNGKLNIPNSFPYKDCLLSRIEGGRRLNEEEQLQRRELAKQRMKEWADGAESKENAMRILEQGDESSSGSYNDAMDEDDADVGTGGSETAGTPPSSTAPTHALASNPDTIPEHLSGPQDVQALALNPSGNPREIATLPGLQAGRVLSQPSPMLDLSMSGQVFRELEDKWYQRYENIAAKLYQEIKEKSVEISRLTGLALGWETEKIKLEESFNLRGALERIAYHGRLLGEIKSHYAQGVQAGLDELAKTAKFKNLLAQEIAARHLVKKDVDRCVAVVYHEASKYAHGNSRMITIYEEDHTPNERAALATFLGVQSGWLDGLKWKEIKRTEQTWC
ncbi:GNL3L/Grn1 putative GTPase-domain-containing protein [Tuber brumale]|nr:GNL3L/Grn1 putative GTPase-domain-containing protein [Tuber brumale]